MCPNEIENSKFSASWPCASTRFGRAIFVRDVRTVYESSHVQFEGRVCTYVDYTVMSSKRAQNLAEGVAAHIKGKMFDLEAIAKMNAKKEMKERLLLQRYVE